MRQVTRRVSEVGSSTFDPIRRGWGPKRRNIKTGALGFRLADREQVGTDATGVSHLNETER